MSYKKLVFFSTLAFCILYAFSVHANPFAELKSSHWAYKSIHRLASKGLLTGYPDGSLSQTESMSRYEAAMIVARILKNLKTDKGRKADSDDHALCEKLTIEFADELALIGVKVTTAQDEMTVMKEVIETTRDDVAQIEQEKQEYIERTRMFRWKGDVELRMESNFYEKDNTSPITDGDANTYDGISLARRPAQVNEDATNFKTRLRLFFDANVENDISGHLQLDNDWANRNNTHDVWGNNADNATSILVREAFIKIDNFFGWADRIKFGRQYYGIANGLVLDGKYDDKCENGVEKDGLTLMKKFSDTVTLDTWFFRTDTDSSTGLNLVGLGINFDFPELKANFTAYYTHRADRQIFDPAAWPGYPHDNSGDYGDITFPIATTPYVAGGTYDRNHNNTTRVHYMGAAMNGDVTRDMKYYTEISVMDFLNSTLDPDDAPTWNDPIEMQTAYLVGFKWNATTKLCFDTVYRSFDEYYRPASSGTDFYDTSRFDKDVIGDTEYENLGYTSDFRDWFLKCNYLMDERTEFLGTYELIDDKRTVTNREDDDMYIASVGMKYRYKTKTSFALYYKYFDLSNFENGVRSLSNMAYDTGTLGLYERGIDSLNLTDPAQEDHQQIRMEMMVKF